MTQRFLKSKKKKAKQKIKILTSINLRHKPSNHVHQFQLQKLFCFFLVTSETYEQHQLKLENEDVQYEALFKRQCQRLAFVDNKYLKMIITCIYIKYWSSDQVAVIFKTVIAPNCYTREAQ